MPVFLWAYYHFDPSTSILFPKCPVHLIFGIPCPGCGSQRAIHALLHRDLAMAFRYNALAVVLLPYLAILAITALLRERFPRLYSITHHRYIAYSLAIIVPLWWILRIIFHWYI